MNRAALAFLLLFVSVQLIEAKTGSAPGKCAVVTLVNAGDDGFTLGAATLGHSLVATGTSMDMVALVTEGIAADRRQLLAAAGWQIVETDAVTNPNDRYYARLKYCFTKLHMYKLSYERVVYLDADVLVLENVDELCNCSGEYCAVVRNTFFNTGVFVFEPSEAQFGRMMELISSTHSYTGCDQGFLNNYFWNPEACPFYDPQLETARHAHINVPTARCHRLPGYYNGDVGMYIFRDDRWQFDPNEERNDPKIAHYTLSVFKPWHWFSYVLVPYSWRWFHIFDAHIGTRTELFVAQLLPLVAFWALHWSGRVDALTARRWLPRAGRLFFANSVVRVACALVLLAAALLLAFAYSAVALYQPTLNLVLFLATFFTTFELLCIQIWLKLARRTKPAADADDTPGTSIAAFRFFVIASTLAFCLPVWLYAFYVYGRIACLACWGATLAIGQAVFSQQFTNQNKI